MAHTRESVTRNARKLFDRLRRQGRHRDDCLRDVRRWLVGNGFPDVFLHYHAWELMPECLAGCAYVRRDRPYNSRQSAQRAAGRLPHRPDFIVLKCACECGRLPWEG